LRSAPGISTLSRAGLEFNRSELRTSELFLTGPVEEWRGSLRYVPEGCDLSVTDAKFSDLPPAVFESLGGAAAAKAMRREVHAGGTDCGMGRRRWFCAAV
jgi:hypothetical protein